MILCKLAKVSTQGLPFSSAISSQMIQLMRLWYLSRRRPAKLRRACTSTQSRQSLSYSYTWSMELDEGSDQKSDILLHWMAVYARLKNEYGDGKCHNLMTWLKCHRSDCGTVASILPCNPRDTGLIRCSYNLSCETINQGPVSIT